MKYRSLDANGDYVVGLSFLSNSPATVAQAVLTRLKLWRGEWFLDTSDGTPWRQDILGRPNGNPDVFIKQRILGTPGVTSIVTYSSTYSGPTRQFTVSGTLDTLYGVTSFVATL
jgi:hypothetical protein